MNDPDPVLSARERHWGPVVLIALVLLAMAIPALPRCEPAAAPPLPAPEPPRVLAVPSDASDLGDATRGRTGGAGEGADARGVAPGR